MKAGVGWEEARLSASQINSVGKNGRGAKENIAWRMRARVPPGRVRGC